MFAQPSPPPLIKSPGEWGSCVAAKGQLYITLLKVITEILNWNHSTARVCQKPLQRCLARSGASLQPRPPEKWSAYVSYHKRRARESPTWKRTIQLQQWWVKTSGGPLSALTCCVNARLLSAIKKISPLIYSQSWFGSWVYTTQAMMTFTLIF